MLEQICQLERNQSSIYLFMTTLEIWSRSRAQNVPSATSGLSDNDSDSTGKSTDSWQDITEHVHVFSS